MRRRESIPLRGGAAARWPRGRVAAWPQTARAQQQGGALYAATRCKSSMIFRRLALIS